MLSGRRKLLLADDSPTIQKVISLTFGDEGLEVVAVGDGGQALRALAEDPPPDVVLADVVMPGPDGYELCERIKRDARLARVPVVLLVGTFEPFNEAEARRVGADTVLTKPFQSIRDLVSKVGTLLGGGEPKEEEHVARPPLDAAPPPPRADASAHVEAEARTAVSEEEPVSHRGEDPAASFADLGADDELIEVKPAEAFGAAAPSLAPTREIAAHAHAEAREPDFQVAAPHEKNGSAAHAQAETNAPVWDAVEFADAAEETDNTGAVLTNQPDEIVMQEQTSPQASDTSSFDARATSAAAADDALLDLGQVDTPAAASVADADDFVLDLDFDDERPAHAAGLSSDSPLDDWRSDSRVPADAPSAFAEAAHGEQPRHFATPTASASPFDEHSSLDQPSAFSEAPASAFVEHDSEGSESSSFFESTPSLDADSSFESPSFAQTEAPWRDVVMQDGPQGFAFGAEPQGSFETQSVGSAPRGFVEPEVVPADEPVPAVVESEYTDGSVEGDLPKSSAAQAFFTEAAPQQQEPSTAGYVVSEGHTRVEETLRADQLSPEAIDAIARRVVELMSDKVVREIAWEVVPDLAELLIKQKLEEERRS